ncbi:MAG TPA: holdfast anchoring protein HfaA [Rhizomicrobium sp.]|nr:holdfast anchoring protein HfaA [Rhizomicrobium sp.]
MTSAKAIAALSLFVATVWGAATDIAWAGDWTNSAAYNGSTASQNQASSYSMRDANGNLTMVDGRVTSSTYSQGSGAQWAGGGVGGGGGLNAYGQATAIGNQLNVVVIGSRNTTIVDSTQINNGNQTATANLNKH